MIRRALFPCLVMLVGLAAAMAAAPRAAAAGPVVWLVHCEPEDGKPFYLKAQKGRDIPAAMKLCRAHGGRVTSVEPLFD